MTRYFLHLRDGRDELLDPDGSEHTSLESLKEEVLSCARDLMAHDMQRGQVDLRFRIDAEDGDGRIVHTLPFKEAFSVIPEG